MCGNSNKTDWMALANWSQQNFFNRRQVEWKLAFSYWGAIASFTMVFVLNKDVLPLGPFDSADIQLAFWIAYWVSAFSWQRAIQVAHARDKAFMLFYLRKYQNKNAVEPDEKVSMPKHGWTPSNFGKVIVQAFTLNWTWWLAHLIVSACVIICCTRILEIISCKKA